jgi:MOSC domain-containing protein YiiM
VPVLFGLQQPAAASTNELIERAEMFAIKQMYAGAVAPLGPKGVPSGIRKSAVPPPWIVTQYGLVGDAQGDLVHHGGPEKAIHHYPVEHYAAWMREDSSLTDALACPPVFGENIAIGGMTEQSVHLGDVYRLGSALLQVCQGRQPCWKLNVRLGRKVIAYKMQSSGRTGWYYRVLQAGEAVPGDGLKLVDRPNPALPLSKLIALVFSRAIDVDELARVLDVPELSSSWQSLLRRRLETMKVEEWSGRLGEPSHIGPR